MKSFVYRVGVDWTGNDGSGTTGSVYGRDSEIATAGKPTIVGSAPREFGGDGVNWSPEELFVAAVSQCHMLTYLFQCSRNGVVVESYRDDAVGTLDVVGAEGGQFPLIELRPSVVISAGDIAVATALHDNAHRGCYIGRSIKTEVRIVPTVTKCTS